MAFYDRNSNVSNFVISWTSEPKKDFGIFSKGYGQAAKRLTTLLVEAPRFSDYEAYPVVFLYRHALELSMKHIIYRSAELAAYRYIDDIVDVLHNTHNLVRLAETVRSSLNLLFPCDDSIQSLLTVLVSTSLEMSELDSDSYGYRYPIDKKGHPSTQRNQFVNLEAFSTHMSSLLEDLETIHFGLSSEIYVEDAMYDTLRNSLVQEV